LFEDQTHLRRRAEIAQAFERLVGIGEMSLAQSGGVVREPILLADRQGKPIRQVIPQGSKSGRDQPPDRPRAKIAHAFVDWHNAPYLNGSATLRFVLRQDFKLRLNDLQIASAVKIALHFPVEENALPLPKDFALFQINGIEFNAVYLEKGKVFRQGQRVFFYGKVERDFYGTGNLQIVQPQFEILPENEPEGGTSIEVGRVVPIYEGMGNLGTRAIRRLISTALASLGDNLPDRLPLSVREKNRLPDHATALRQTHFPDSDQPLERLCNFRTPAQVRLIFEEFFNVGAGLALRRRKGKAAQGIEFEAKASARAAIRSILPFHPTVAQKRVLKEIVDDMCSPHPMNRLLQGDVGSGKTIVAIQAAILAIENGYQVALMAPTEILATQHYLYTRALLQSLPYTIDLLISARKAADKTELKERMGKGEINLVVGTHALLEEDVAFSKLGLVVVDEQHRFGVLQRFGLIRKAA